MDFEFQDVISIEYTDSNNSQTLVIETKDTLLHTFFSNEAKKLYNQYNIYLTVMNFGNDDNE